MPHVGAIWIWRGNTYEVVGIESNTILIEEYPTPYIKLKQTLSPDGKWSEPSLI